MGDRLLDQRDLAVEEVDLAQAAVEGLAFLDRQLELGQAGAALLAEQVTRLRAALQPPEQDRVDLVLGARARPNQLRAPRQPAPHHSGALVGHPHAVQRPRGQQLRQRPRVQPVGLGPRLADAGVARRDDDHALDVRLDDPRDLPRIAGDLQHHLIVRGQALRERLQHLRAGRDPARRPDPTGLGDRDLAEVAVHIQPDRSHHRSLRRLHRRAGRTVGQRHRRIRARSAIGSVAGAATEKLGLNGPSNENGLPTLRSPDGPKSSHRTVGPDPDGAVDVQFHPPKSSPLAARG